MLVVVYVLMSQPLTVAYLKIKFIKFFAWENRWIDRVSDARATEIKWMIKSRLNWVLFQLLWSCAPVLVSIISFLVFVLRGNELTVSTAFTVRLLLFVLIYETDRMSPGDRPIQHGQASSQCHPNVDCSNIAGKQSSVSIFLLNILPFQTKVALDRIATYLDEDEVDEQVSSLKRSHFGGSAGDDNTTKSLGIENGTFKWNEVEEKGDDSAKTPKNVISIPTNDVVQGANDETERGSITPSEASNHRFELRDVNVVFPERQLSVVTGPTASGKTALLVSF